MHSFKNDLLFAGLEPREFHSLLPDAQRENRKNLESFSLILAVLFFVLFLVRLPGTGVLSVNVPVYLAASAACCAVFCCARKLLPAHPRATMPLARVFMAVLYLFSFSLLFLHREYPSVTALVVLLVVPFLFTDRPISTVSISIAATAVFCCLSYWQKTPELASLDSWNALSFGLLAVIAAVFQRKIKFRALRQAREIKILSETDLLTGTQNRNSYENKLARHPVQSAHTVTCLYADVNGLHELNNRCGHKAGDAMLKAVASALIDRFGAKNTYRVGGDEFVAFQPDAEDAEADARQITSALAAQGYHVSIGVACHEKAGIDMLELVREAEKNMFLEKQNYYQQLGNDRRKR